MNIPGLASLLTPDNLELFMTEAWPKSPFVVHDLGESVASLTELPFLASIESLLKAWPYSVQAHLPDASDESSAIDVPAADAKKLFANNMALLFNNLERLSPVLTDWLVELKEDLGLPTSTYARCMAYATPDGKGTATHFDQNVNFVLQLHGTKKWRLAENTSFVNPLQRHTLGQNLDHELASYAEAPLPTEMPEDAHEIVLQPGSLLFVPRGFWHATEASGEALALNFTFSQPTWIDLFTAALRSRLALSPEWRELADGVTSLDDSRRFLAENKFDELLLGLVDDLPNWRAADVLAATEEL